MSLNAPTWSVLFFGKAEPGKTALGQSQVVPEFQQALTITCYLLRGRLTGAVSCVEGTCQAGSQTWWWLKPGEDSFSKTPLQLIRYHRELLGLQDSIRHSCPSTRFDLGGRVRSPPGGWTGHNEMMNWAECSVCHQEVYVLHFPKHRHSQCTKWVMKRTKQPQEPAPQDCGSYQRKAAENAEAGADSCAGVRRSGSAPGLLDQPLAPATGWFPSSPASIPEGEGSSGANREQDDVQHSSLDAPASSPELHGSVHVNPSHEPLSDDPPAHSPAEQPPSHESPSISPAPPSSKRQRPATMAPPMPFDQVLQTEWENGVLPARLTEEFLEHAERHNDALRQWPQVLWNSYVLHRVQKDQPRFKAALAASQRPHACAEGALDSVDDLLFDQEMYDTYVQAVVQGRNGAGNPIHGCPELDVEILCRARMLRYSDRAGAWQGIQDPVRRC